MSNKSNSVSCSKRLRATVLVSYLSMHVTILLGLIVKVFEAGDACGKNWPLCPPLFENFNFLALLEASHRFASLLTTLTMTGTIAMSLAMKNRDYYASIFSIFGLLILESCIGMIIVVRDLPNRPLDIEKSVVYSLHPVISLCLLGLTGLLAKKIIASSHDFEGSSKLWFLALVASYFFGSINSMILQSMNAYNLTNHQIIINAYIEKPILLAHNTLGLILGAISCIPPINGFKISVFLTFLSGLLIPLLEFKPLICLHFSLFLISVHLCLFDKVSVFRNSSFRT
ncbi:MAG: COX15/CtaA family protein [Deltaproteobacteria bacterium]|nr:COX15/CtaA family protein [Deltaproteobacteria bacterium]